MLIFLDTLRKGSPPRAVRRTVQCITAFGLSVTIHVAGTADENVKLGKFVQVFCVKIKVDRSEQTHSCHYVIDSDPTAFVMTTTIMMKTSCDEGNPAIICKREHN